LKKHHAFLICFHHAGQHGSEDGAQFVELPIVQDCGPLFWLAQLLEVGGAERERERSKEIVYQDLGEED